MCRGLAVLCDKQGRFFSKGINSHTCSLGRLKEDDCLKFEVIIDDSKKEGYSAEVDEQYRKNSKQGKEAGALLKECKAWVKENELQVLRWLLTNRIYSRAKEDRNDSHQETGGNRDDRYQETGGNRDDRCQETTGEIYIEYIKNNHKPTDKFIKELSEQMNKENKRLTWKHLVKLAIEGSKRKGGNKR